MEGAYTYGQTEKIVRRISGTRGIGAVRIRTRKTDSPLPMTASKFGGLPYWTAGEEYPKDEDGNALTLLAQINFADVPNLPDFPEKGLLQFFILADGSYGLDLEGTAQNYWRIVWREDADESLALGADALHGMGISSAAETGDDGRDFPFSGEFSLSFEKTVSHPNRALSDYDGMVKAAAGELGLPVLDEAGGAFDEDYTEANEGAVFCEDAQDGPLHQMGGYPFFTQDDVQEEGDVLLLQIDSDEDITWGDNGIANFFIKRAALKNCDFSNARYNWDCY